jgi:hypothetical protein
MAGGGNARLDDPIQIGRHDLHGAQGNNAKHAPDRFNRLRHLGRIQIDALPLLPNLALDALDLEAHPDIPPQLAEKVSAVLALEADLAIAQHDPAHQSHSFL